MDSRLISQLFLVILSALIQNFSWFNFGGIKVNLPLIVIFSFAFIVKNWPDYLLLSLSSAYLLRTNSGWDFTIFIFLAVTFLVYLLKKFLPWRSLLSYLIFTAVGTFLFYLVIDFQFLRNDYFIFLKELIYNILFGGLIYLILASFYVS